VDAVTPLLGTIDEDMSVTFGTHAVVSIKGKPYPDFEANQYGNDGRTTNLAQLAHDDPGGPGV
jgi:hypothetical protein